MGNLTTPFKASILALISHKLVELLGMTDADAAYVGEASWLLLTAALAYLVPADLGSGLAARLLGWVLRLRTGAPALVAIAVLASSGLLGGCTATTANGQPPSAEEIRELRERRCEVAETMAAGGKLAAVIVLEDETDPDLRNGIGLALVAVDVSVATYCDAVRTGADPDAQRAALAGLRAAIDRLTQQVVLGT